MILSKVRIKNYKSILDSKEFSLQPDYVVFAGKNESGKSTILKALEKINNPSFKEEERPKGIAVDAITQITYKFNFTQNEQRTLSEKYDFDINDDEVIVDIENTSKIISFPTITEKKENYKKEILNQFILDNSLKVTDFDDRACETIITELDNQLFIIETPEDKKLHTELMKIRDDFNKLESDLIKDIKSYIPQIIYHPDFRNTLPSSFKLTDLNKPNEGVMLKRLESYLNTDFSKIFNETDTEKRYEMTESLSKDIDSDFQTIFRQNRVKIKLSIDKDTITIRVQDIETGIDGDNESKSIKLTERSEGFQWYFNFFITLKGGNIKDGDIILLDEPGVYLHPKAQMDMLDFIKNQAHKYQIIFTSHSPYLINKDELSRLRLVENENKTIGKSIFKETLVREKIHAATDKDTLIPIIDAIGYTIPDINLNFHNIIITEGVSDYYYIKKIMQINKIDFSKTNITFAKSADKIEELYSMYLGLGFKNIYIILDSDNKGKKIYKDLKNNMVENVFFINEMNINGNSISGKEMSIEDIFEKDFFKKNILGKFSKLDQAIYDSLDFTKPNSHLVKQYEIAKNLSTIKWLMSKEFHDNEEIQNYENMLIPEASHLITILREIESK